MVKLAPSSLSIPEKMPFGTYSWPLAIFYFALMLETTFVNKATVFVAMVILFLLNYKKKSLTLNQLSKVSSLLVLHLIGVLSYFWSFVPHQTLIYVVNDLQLLAMAYLIAQFSVDKDIAQTLKLSSIAIILSAFIYSLIFFGESMSPIGLKSFYNHKNGLGAILTVSLLFIIFAPNFKRKDTIFLTIGLILLVFSESKTSIGLLVIIALSVAFVFILKRLYQSLTKYTQGFIKLCFKPIPIVLYLLIVLMVVFRNEVASYFIQTIPNDLFTGRGLLWLTVLTRTKDDLLLGIGPGAFWGAGGAERLSEIAQTPLYLDEWIQRLKAGDGGYIDIIGSHGFLGLGLLLISIVQAYKLVIHHASHYVALPAFCAMTFLVLHNITESDIFRFVNIPWFLFQFFMFYLAMLPEDKKYQITN